MRIARLTLALAAAVAVTPMAMAQRKTGIAESGLIGIKLFDSGQKLVAVYGTPDQVEPVNLGGGTTGGGGGGRGPGGSGAPGGFGGPPGRGGGGGGGGMAPSADAWNNPFGFGDDLLRQRRPTGSSSSGGGGGSASGPPSGYPGGSGAPGGYPGGSGGGIPGGGSGAPGGRNPGGGGGGATEEVTFTRWVYNRAGSKYGFILDKQGRVIQIEAIGLQNGKVKTRAGLGFGSTFAQIIKAYGTPDSYEISGDNILMKYLQRRKVAFRLSRLGEKKAQVVTGVVVAAGKA